MPSSIWRRTSPGINFLLLHEWVFSLRDYISHDAYKAECFKLLDQYKVCFRVIHFFRVTSGLFVSLRIEVAMRVVRGTDVDTFVQKYRLHCPAALERIRDGRPIEAKDDRGNEMKNIAFIVERFVFTILSSSSPLHPDSSPPSIVFAWRLERSMNSSLTSTTSTLPFLQWVRFRKTSPPSRKWKNGMDLYWLAWISLTTKWILKVRSSVSDGCFRCHHSGGAKTGCFRSRAGLQWVHNPSPSEEITPFFCPMTHLYTI